MDLNVFDLIDHHQSEKCAYARCSNTASYEISLPTCLFNPERRRCAHYDRTALWLDDFQYGGGSVVIR